MSEAVIAQNELVAAMGRASSGYGRDGSAFFGTVTARLVELISASSVEAVLDAGTGPGTALVNAAHAWPDASLVGVDLSPEMVKEARARLRSLGIDADLRVMDAESLAFSDDSFGVVLCASALYQFPHPDQALQEFRRVLGVGGELGVSIYGEPDPRWAKKDQLFAKLAPALPRVGRRFSADQLFALLETVGFDCQEMVRERLDVRYRDAADWTDAAWKHGERRALDAMSAEAMRHFENALPPAIEEAREDDGLLHWRPEVVYAIATRR